MIVKEYIDFKRGVSSKSALDIGYRKQVNEWAQEMVDLGALGDFDINEDYTITTYGRVDLRDGPSGNLPDYIKFKECKKSRYPDGHSYHDPYYYFSAAGIGLTSLKGMPDKIEGQFSIGKNHLVDLTNCPWHIGKDFDLDQSELYSLEGAPKFVGGDVYAYGNPGNFTEEDIRKAIPNIGGIVRLEKKKW